MNLNIINIDNSYLNEITNIKLNKDKNNYLKIYDTFFEYLNVILYNLNEDINDVTEARQNILDMQDKGINIGTAEVTIIEQYINLKELVININEIFKIYKINILEYNLYNE